LSAQPWTERYKPTKPAEFVGNDAAIQTIRSWLDKWSKTTSRGRKALLLFGPPGVGKTAAVYVVAAELGFEVTEINASDKRSKGVLEQLLGSATTSGSLFGRRGRIVLVDELSGLSGSSDRGATTALADLIRETRVPIVLVTDDITEEKIAPIRLLCQAVEFQPLPDDTIVKQLARICLKEGVKHDRSALEYIAKQVKGDLRAAINDLQAVVRSGGTVSIENARRLLKWRDRTLDVTETLDRIFYAQRWNDAIEAADQTDVYPDELLRWISCNVPLVFHNSIELSNAFRWLSRSSLFSQRIRQTQDWKLLPYFRELMCVTGSIVGSVPVARHFEYRYPEWIRQMGRSKSFRQKEKDVGVLLSSIVHASWKVAYREYAPILKALLENRTRRVRVQEDLGLTEDMASFILKQNRG
jgi:replication factor C large subunit